LVLDVKVFSSKMFNLFHKFSLSNFSSSKYFSISRIFRLKIFSKIFHQKMTKNTKEVKKKSKKQPYGALPYDHRL